MLRPKVSCGLGELGDAEGDGEEEMCERGATGGGYRTPCLPVAIALLHSQLARKDSLGSLSGAHVSSWGNKHTMMKQLIALSLTLSISLTRMYA